VAQRILLLITDLELGGTPTVVRELALRLQGPASVEVVCLAENGPVGEQLTQAGIPVTALGARSARDLPRILPRLVHLIRQGRFDTLFSFLVHANALAAMAAWFCRDVRFLQSIQTTQPLPRWHWWVQGIAAHWAERIVVPSPSVAEAAQVRSGIAASKIVVIPNAIDLEPFAHVAQTRRPSADGLFRIGFIGRLDPIKRIGDLIRAVGALDRVRLDLFGEGQERPTLEHLIAQLHLADRISLHGAIAHPADALRQIDLLVLPSQAEGFGLVLIEAMAAGIPIVATDVPGIRDVVQDGVNGLLVPPANPPALAAAIQRLREDPRLRDTLVRQAAAHVQHRFIWPVILPQYREVLRV
jgi:glycosyltransferase involved in cell wall biosynthesis